MLKFLVDIEYIVANSYCWNDANFESEYQNTVDVISSILINLSQDLPERRGYPIKYYEDLRTLIEVLNITCDGSRIAYMFNLLRDRRATLSIGSAVSLNLGANFNIISQDINNKYRLPLEDYLQRNVKDRARWIASALYKMASAKDVIEQSYYTNLLLLLTSLSGTCLLHLRRLPVFNLYWNSWFDNKLVVHGVTLGSVEEAKSMMDTNIDFYNVTQEDLNNALPSWCRA